MILTNRARYIGDPERVYGECSHSKKMDCDFMPTCPGPIDGECRFSGGGDDMTVFEEYEGLFAEPPKLSYQRFHELAKSMTGRQISDDFPYENWFVFSVMTGRLWIVPFDVMRKFMSKPSSPIYAVTSQMCPLYDVGPAGMSFIGYRSLDDDDSFVDKSTASEIGQNAEDDMSAYLEVELV